MIAESRKQLLFTSSTGQDMKLRMRKLAQVVYHNSDAPDTDELQTCSMQVAPIAVSAHAHHCIVEDCFCCDILLCFFVHESCILGPKYFCFKGVKNHKKPVIFLWFLPQKPVIFGKAYLQVPVQELTNSCGKWTYGGSAHIMLISTYPLTYPLFCHST